MFMGVTWLVGWDELIHLSINPSIHLYFTGVGNWSLSQMLLGERRSTPWTSRQPIARLIYCIGQTVLSNHSLIYILVSNWLIPQINVFGPADFDSHTLDNHISTSLAICLISGAKEQKQVQQQSVAVETLMFIVSAVWLGRRTNSYLCLLLLSK